MDIKLYVVKEKMFLNIDGDDGENVYEFKINDRYFVRFGEFGNGGWPQIYIPKLEGWYDIVLQESDTKILLSDDCSGVTMMIQADKDMWSDEEKEAYLKFTDTDLQLECKSEENNIYEFWDLCDRIEKVFVEFDIDINQIELANMVYNLVNSQKNI